MEVSAFNITLNHCCNKFISNNLSNDPIDIAKTTKLLKRIWHEERKFRITGSRIYEIFTYSGNNWTDKNEKYFNPKHFTNKFIAHGLAHEDAARQRFIEATNKTVYTFGLIVPSNNNWLGYSPDGVIFHGRGKPTALLEIKCPYAGKQ